MESFVFEGFSIERMIAHTIFPRTKEGNIVDPQLSSALIKLDPESKDLLQVRITDALGSKSHGIEVALEKDGEGSFMQRAALAIRANDSDYISISRDFAKSLAEAQTNPKWPGGVLIVITGKVGKNQNYFIAVIKAETDQGFNIVETGGSVNLSLIKRMLLSQTQRLYKIGLFLEVNYQAPVENLYAASNYRYFLFDHLLTSTETKSAAAYFYNAFLGMNIVKSSKFQTRKFYEDTRAFIGTMDVSREDKVVLLEALRSELRSNKGTMSIASFAEDHLPTEAKGKYTAEMVDKGSPNTAMIKDLAYIKAKLRRPRKVEFTTGIKIQVPSDLNFAEHIKIESQIEGYTTVKIKGVMESQE